MKTVSTRARRAKRSTTLRSAIRKKVDTPIPLLPLDPEHEKRAAKASIEHEAERVLLTRPKHSEDTEMPYGCENQTPHLGLLAHALGRDRVTAAHFAAGGLDRASTALTVLRAALDPENPEGPISHWVARQFIYDVTEGARATAEFARRIEIVEGDAAKAKVG